jgi:hypothetical protein
VLAPLAFLLVCAPAWAADYSVTASGRCVAEDGTPIPGARVELRDQDLGVPVETDVAGPLLLSVTGNDVCASGHTDAQGRFHLSGRCGDFGPSIIGWTKPDLYVRCALQGRAGRIFQNRFPWTLYNATTRPRKDSAAALNAGDIRLPTGASKAFITLGTVYDKAKSLTGATLLDVWTLYPGGRQAVIENTGQTYFASYAGAVFMSIAAGDEGGTVAHEYGHTLQFQSYLQDLFKIRSVLNILRAGWEALKHPTGAGHTFSTRSNVVMAFAEGWAEFMEGVVFGTGLPDCSTWTEVGAKESERIEVEGNIACRLFRLYRKWGFRDIWKAQTASKAARYDHFFAEYLKIHPDAAAVASPPRLVALRALAVSPLLLAARIEPQKVAATTLALRPAVAEVQLATRPLALDFARRKLLSPAVTKTLVQAEGAHCGVVRDAYRRQVAALARACSGVKDPAVMAECQSKAAVRTHADSVYWFCPPR